MRTRVPSLICLAMLACAPARAQEQPEPVPMPPAALPAVALPTVALPPELAGVLRDYEQAWTLKQPAALAALFAADGMALPNGSEPARGPAQIAARYPAAAGTPLSLRPLAYAVTHDMAYVVGGFAPTAGEPDLGKFVLVLRRGPDGAWKIVADIDNMNAQPQASEPEPAAADAPSVAPPP